MSSRAEIEAQIRRDEDIARRLQEDEMQQMVNMGGMMFSSRLPDRGARERAREQERAARAARNDAPSQSAPPQPDNRVFHERFSIYYGGAPHRHNEPSNPSQPRPDAPRGNPTERFFFEGRGTAQRPRDDFDVMFDSMREMMASVDAMYDGEDPADPRRNRANRRARTDTHRPAQPIDLMARLAERMLDGAGGFGDDPAGGGRFFGDAAPGDERPRARPGPAGGPFVGARPVPMGDLFGSGMMSLFHSMFGAGAGNAPTTYEEFLDMIERRGNVSRGATDNDIATIPVVPYRDVRAASAAAASSSAAGRAAGVDDREKCVICLTEFSDDDKVMKLPCTHIFHDECVSRWLRVNRTCPSCKRSIRSDDQPES